jgi:hypothetical protein
MSHSLSYHVPVSVIPSGRPRIIWAKGDIFVMIDIIDDDSENRWLSLCFYDDMDEDPDEKRDFVPGGLVVIMIITIICSKIGLSGFE